MNMIQMTTLPSGIRVITDYVDSVHSVALGVWVNVGTRNEDLAYNGVAHMVEHMLFKGTKTRNAQQIAEVLENVGGHMNAYTSREITSYYAHVLKEDAPLALELLADMLQHSILPENEIERERHVILQEIGMSIDTPDDLVFDNYFETVWQNQALGAPILGTADIISVMQKETLYSYINKYYTPKNLVLSAAGNIAHDQFVAQVADLFCDLPPDQSYTTSAARYDGGVRKENKDLEQAHVMLGYQAPQRTDGRYYSAKTLSKILGEGMSSRLFQEVREKRGLAYSVFSYLSSHHDDGTFAVYAGTAPEKVDELLSVIGEQVASICDNVSENELLRAKAQLKGGMLMHRESMISRVDQNARYLLYKEQTPDIDRTIGNIDAVSVEAVQAVAQDIFATPQTLCTLGPLEKAV